MEHYGQAGGAARQTEQIVVLDPSDDIEMGRHVHLLQGLNRADRRLDAFLRHHAAEEDDADAGVIPHRTWLGVRSMRIAVVRQIEDRLAVSRFGERGEFLPFHGDHVGAARQGVHEGAISRATVLVVMDETPGANVERHAFAQAPGQGAEHRLRIEKVPIERGEVENVVAPALLHHLQSDGGEAARVGCALAELCAERQRVGELDDVDAAQPEVVDQTAIGGFIAAACRLSRLCDGAAIGDADSTRTQLASHLPASFHLGPPAPLMQRVRHGRPVPPQYFPSLTDGYSDSGNLGCGPAWPGFCIWERNGGEVERP